MEIANLERSLARATIRVAEQKDAPEILRLINGAAHSHIHADWHAPGDWMGTPGFVVSEGMRPSKSLTGFGRVTPRLLACLAAAPDPLPAAWVRLAAVRERFQAEELMVSMLEAVLPSLETMGVTELGWLAADSWPDALLPALNFQRLNWIITFVKEGLDVPFSNVEGIVIRPVLMSEMDRLAAIEAAAFDPLWRHSAAGFRLAYKHAICFDVALVDEQIVGFQYSASNYNGTGAHLVRITIHPAYQGLGVGSALMQRAFQEYRRRGIRRVSLNTQLDNIASHRLYEKFGFRRTGDQMPVWVSEVNSG